MGFKLVSDEVNIMNLYVKFRKQVPMPETCPFCGRKLTSENAEIDHIIPMYLGGTNDFDNLRYLCMTCHRRKADKYSPLLAYFIKLMKAKGCSDNNSSEVIEYLLRNATVKDLEDLCKRVESKDPAFKAYADDFEKMLRVRGGIPEPSSDELAELMLEIVKEYENYNFKNELRKEINGNIFSYTKDFPIEKYTDVLASYGEEETGEVYSVYLDEEGELVVY